MGTRRSRHNKGRKPLYKEYRSNLIPDAMDAFDDRPVLRPTSAQILSHQKYGGAWWDHNMRWDQTSIDKLTVLCASAANIEKSADALGRPPTNLAHRARDMRLILPPAWSQLIQKHRSATSRASKVLLCYPYVEKVRDEHADLLRVNEIIPKAIPDWERADICQEILLALLEGTTSFDELERNSQKVQFFRRKFNRDYKPWNEVQIGNRFGQESDDDRSYDEIAANARNVHPMETHTAADQIEAVFQKEVTRTFKMARMRGVYVNRDEVEYALNGNHWNDMVGTFANG